MLQCRPLMPGSDVSAQDMLQASDDDEEVQNNTPVKERPKTQIGDSWIHIP